MVPARSDWAVAVAVARDVDDALAEVVRAHPDRLQGFATLPTQDPTAAAAELDRTVTRLGFCGAMLYGRTGDVLPDDPRFDELYDTAQRLRVPLHFHPQTPRRPVLDAYFSGLGGGTGSYRGGGMGLATAGLGWYCDLGVQYLRMIFTGVFGRHPDLQVVAGHWGEVVLYSTDYPHTFGTRPGGFRYLDTAGGVARSFLADAPFTAEQKAAVGSGNGEHLMARAADDRGAAPPRGRAWSAPQRG